MTQKERLKWLELSLAGNLLQRDLYLLYQLYGDPGKILNADKQELKSVIGPRAINDVTGKKTLDEELNKMKSTCTRMVFIEDEEYPVLLKEIKNPPLFLRVRGKIPENSERIIAVVGTRKASSYGRSVCILFSKQISERKFTVVSGLARGIDTIAHNAVLEENNQTVAVMGCGCDVIYPRENGKLVERIIRSGAVISEYPMGTPPSKYHFPERNRIISGMSCGVLVVEAPQKSGALITASFAADQGRDVWTVCGSIYDKNYKGCHSLIKDGAKLCESIDDIMSEINLPGLGNDKESENKTEMNVLTEHEALIYKTIGWHPVTIDLIRKETGYEMSEIYRVLTNLEINGFIKSTTGGKFIRLKELNLL
ncbi:MAG: DNA-processing protein DprA [Planctomycetota bacterium]